MAFVSFFYPGLLCKFLLKQSPQAWFGKFSHIVLTFGLKLNETDHSVFYCHSSSRKCVYLMVYINYIVIIVNDIPIIAPLKKTFI